MNWVGRPDRTWTPAVPCLFPEVRSCHRLVFQHRHTFRIAAISCHPLTLTDESVVCLWVSNDATLRKKQSGVFNLCYRRLNVPEWSARYDASNTYLTRFSVRAQKFTEPPDYTAVLLGSELILVFVREVRFVLAVCPRLSVVYLELHAPPAVLTAGVITNYTTAGRPAVRKVTHLPKTSEM